MFKSPGAVAFSLFSYDVHWYGIIMAFAILAGILLILHIRKYYFKDIPEDNIYDVSFLLIIAGIISARLYYVILDWNYFRYNLKLIPCIWHGGISIHGAILGGLIAFYIYSKIKKIDFLKYADLFSFGLIIGQIAGRWGNFFNSEAFGLPCNLPWKLYIPVEARPLDYVYYQYFHPAFLYESLLNILVLIILFCILKYSKNRQSGLIFFSYCYFYGIVRHFVETIRVDSVLNIASGFHAAHLASALLMIFGLIGFVYLYTKKA